MITALYVIDALLAVLLIVSVVLQSGKSAGLSGSIAGGAEVLLGGKRKGLDEILARVTVVISVLFAITTLIIVKITQY
ncbi:MAG: preprotein translocase subunit SecG [Negativicutes bacterium]|nr:preprotein translocase subunit SecG [Negativicutes bacterium]